MITKSEKRKIKELINAINKSIANAPTSEAREELKQIYFTLLIKADLYNGFNYNYWLNSGYLLWVQAGKPKDKTPYLGDKSLVTFY